MKNKGSQMKKHKIKLGVNLDHVATLRQVRGGTTPYPNLVEQMKVAVKGGADQITIHLREDRRHIQDKDVAVILKACKKHNVLLNLEIAPTSEMIAIALKKKPHCVCLVPEKRKELTTEGGLNVLAMQNKLKKYIHQLKGKNILVSLFIDPDLEQVEASAVCGADAIELHTGSFVISKGSKAKKEWKALEVAACLAHQLQLRVHAGHGLDDRTTPLICHLSYLQELNIGHFIVCEALNVGLQASVRKIKKLIFLSK